MPRESRPQNANRIANASKGYRSARSKTSHYRHAFIPPMRSAVVKVASQKQEPLDVTGCEGREGREGDDDVNSTRTSHLSPSQPLGLPVLPGTPSSKALEALRSHPVLRCVVYRPGRAFSGPNRTGNHEATIGTCVGTIASVACFHCQGAGGPFAKCVIVKGYLNGACTNCHFNSEGTRCSFRHVGSSGWSSAGSSTSIGVVPTVVRPSTSSSDSMPPASPASPIHPSINLSSNICKPSLAEQLPVLMAGAKAMSWCQRRQRRAELEMELSVISWADSRDMFEEEQKVIEEADDLSTSPFQSFGPITDS